MFSREGLSPVERMTTRFEKLMGAETPVILECESICYMRTFKNIPGIFTDEEWKEISDKHYIHELGYLSNLTPNYEKAIKCGLILLKEEADSYGKRMIDAIIGLADRYKDEAIKQSRTDIAEILERVPKYGATSLRETLQMFRILHFSLWYEGNYHITVGRFDKYIYPLVSSFCLSVQKSALELLEDFFVLFNKDSDLYPGVQQGDNGQSMMLGGVDEDGNDIYNKLSELCLKASYNKIK